MDVFSERASDASISPLPHPVRVQASLPKYEEAFATMLNADWPHVLAALKDEALILPAALNRLSREKRCPRFMQFMQAMGCAPSSTEQGGAFAILDYLRYRALSRPHFLVDDALVRMLELTDISPDIPVSYLMPPFPGLYLELGKERTSPLMVPNLTTGNHVLEGAYIEYGEATAGLRALHIMLVGSPVGKSGPLDDATLSMVLDMSDPDKLLEEALTEGFARAGVFNREQGLRPTPESFIGYSREALLMMAKVLLYLNMPDVRKELKAERSEAERALTKVKATAKKSKATRKLAKLYDYVLVTSEMAAKAPGAPAGHPGEEGRMPLRAHWRRGHLRMQACGPQWKERKLMHIPPVLVGKGDTVAPSRYLVR